MSQITLAQHFHSLHQKQNPLILYNVWDAATAHAAEKAGAKAIATGSWSVAAAHGYADGENIPLDFVKFIIERIVHTTNLPVTVDFECGYAKDLPSLKNNFRELLGLGIVGINFEDQIIEQDDLFGIADQSERIAALRETADAEGVAVFINARTDLFLKEPDAAKHGELIDEAIERGQAYIKHGASGIFIPSISDLKLIRTICQELNAPVNIMAGSDIVDASSFQNTGVARISYGPHPFFEAMTKFEHCASLALK